MKPTRIPLLLFFLLNFCIVFSQEIFIANNNPSAPVGANIFATIQEAVDAAASGDIIHLIPSPTAYGNAIVTKQLKIVGPGYNPGTQHAFTTVVGTISLEGAAASNTIITGVVIGRLNLATSTGSAYTLSNILLAFNKIDILEQTVSNIVSGLYIRNNLMGPANAGTPTIKLATDANIEEAYIENNIINGWNAGVIVAGNFTIINHNIIQGTENGNSTFGAIDKCIVTNNIITGFFNLTTLPINDNSFYNNITHSTRGINTLNFNPSGNNNVEGNNIMYTDPLLVSYPFAGTFYFIGQDPTPIAGSPCLLAGSDGEDIGVSGGNYEYDPATAGAIGPFISNFQITTPIVNAGQNIEISVTAQGN